MTKKLSVDRRDFLKSAAATSAAALAAGTRREPVPMPGLLGTAIAVCAIGVVGMGVYPRPWVVFAERVASTLFP